MPKVAYFDCFSGASGDMVLGAIVDAGLPFERLVAEIQKLPLPSGAYELSVTKVLRAGYAATKVDVKVNEPPKHRSLEDVLAIIRSSALPEGDKANIDKVFRAIGQAEAKVHGRSPGDVQLHEVGAVDAMVDVTGAVAGLRLLGVDEVFVSALPVGHGEARGSHGGMPVPAPATLELLCAAGAPVTGEGPPGELVTPTGAAILSVLGRFERPALRVHAVGYGAGSRDPADRPNVLRLWLGEVGTALRTMRLLETNIDDMAPELLAYVQERLLAAGAADAWFTSIQMKKSRPGVMLSVLCSDGLEAEIVRLVLRETTTLGIRSREVRRFEAEREQLEFESSLGPAAVKVKRLPGEPPRIAPEYEVCRRLAEASGLPLAEVYRTVAAEAERILAGR